MNTIFGVALAQPGCIETNLIDQLLLIESNTSSSCGFYSIESNFDTFVIASKVGSIKGLIDVNDEPPIPEAQIPLMSVGFGVINESEKIPDSLYTIEPMTDSMNRVVVAKVGSTIGHQEVKKTLEQHYRFQTDTDTEVIIKLLHRYLTLNEETGFDLVTAMSCIEHDLGGRYSIVASDSTKQELVALQHGKALMIFQNQLGTYISSNIDAFGSLGKGEVYFMGNSEIAMITPLGYKIYNNDLKEVDVRTVSTDSLIFFKQNA